MEDFTISYEVVTEFGSIFFEDYEDAKDEFENNGDALFLNKIYSEELEYKG